MQRVGAVVLEREILVHDDVQAHLVALALVEGAQHVRIPVADDDRERASAGLRVRRQSHLRDVHELLRLLHLHLQGHAGRDDRAPEFHLHGALARLGGAAAVEK